jgi:Ca2+:H+ antiporter
VRSKLSKGDGRLLAGSCVLTAASGVTRYAHAGRVAPFVVAGAGLAVLAAVVGRSVDRLGDRLGAGLTGVVQSALGNLPELFLGIFALRAGLVSVVQAALVGSVLANILLVLGLAFVVGGVRHGTQRFPADSARNLALLLLLAVAVLLLPSFSSHLNVAVAHHERALSDVASAVLLAVFVLAVPGSVRRGSESQARDAGGGDPAAVDPAAGTLGERQWSTGLVVTVLLIASIAAAFVSDWFVDSLTPALSALHMSQAFAGLVVVAIAGNAVENVVGIQLAARNRADYAVQVILQSPLQIALALFPALVLLSPVIGGAPLTLVLPPLLAVVLGLTAIVTVVVVYDGESTWLEGACLLGLYVIVATSFWWG